MYYINCLKFSIRAVSALSLFSFVLLLAANPANAFSLDFNTDFETGGLSDWDTTGDTSIQQTLTGTYNNAAKAYNAGTGNQLVLTTSCSSTAYTPTTTGYDNTECFNTQDETAPRNDDFNATVGTFNYSGNDLTDANAENSGTTVPGATEITNVQEFLDVSGNALDIVAQDGDTDIGGNRIAKEGSAAILNNTINADNDFQISFDWNYLTNDGQDEFLGDSDYGFAVIYDETSEITTREPTVLADSNLTIPTITADDDAYALLTEGEYVSEILPAGNYKVGFGVVDADGVSRSSALLVDNFSVREVPFEFSPATGIGLVATFFCLNRLRGKSKQQMQSKFIVVAIDSLIIDWLVVNRQSLIILKKDAVSIMDAACFPHHVPYATARLLSS